MLSGSLSLHTRRIQKVYPDLQIQTVRPFGDEGQFNDLLIVNDALVFRFPKFAQGIEMLKRETTLLKRIHGLTTLPTPDPIYAALEPPILGQVFMGYPLLPGEPLFREMLSLAGEEALDRLARQLAGFMRELHGLPLEQVGLDLPIQDDLRQWENLYQAVQADLYVFMPPEDQAWTSRHFETYLQDESLHVYQPSLRHGDLGPSNILYEAQAGRISGIIDFGFAGLGDPAIDLAAVSTFGPDFFARICRYYPGSQDMLPRAHFYLGTFALQEALHGYRNEDLEAFERGLAM